MEQASAYWSLGSNKSYGPLKFKFLGTQGIDRDFILLKIGSLELKIGI